MGVVLYSDSQFEHDGSAQTINIALNSQAITDINANNELLVMFLIEPDFNDLTDSIKEDRKELSRLKKLDWQGFEVDKDRLKSLASDIETAKKEKSSMVGIAGDVASSENIKRNVAKIEELADKILEDNDLEATEENLLIAKARAADIVRRVPSLQFEQSPTSLGIQRGADDSYGRIQR